MPNPGDRNADGSDSKWVSQALIKGPSAVFVQNGSPVTFTCEILPLSLQSGVFFAARPPVRWLHDGKEVSFELSGDNVSVETEHDDQRISSKLRLASVSWKDSGQYTCMQPSSKPAFAKLIVVEGMVLPDALKLNPLKGI
ncbi:hypothetical protein NQ315_002975 [Exocentrus adspersus]|uniref:Ig-like domain-containing protein n=1 Tax=Exocentrus adspersus TaxID=1586481 RepID=A0AAV8W4W0_9CUCU|nr:hypothetical protein NQ315_002975 [Exocentrus adspersus]